jgi:hypothetical protein
LQTNILWHKFSALTSNKRIVLAMSIQITIFWNVTLSTDNHLPTDSTETQPQLFSYDTGWLTNIKRHILMYLMWLRAPSSKIWGSNCCSAEEATPLCGWHYIMQQTHINISKRHAASIFSVEATVLLP